jgi:hypothetical protein
MKILDMDLTKEDQKELAELLSEWKETQKSEMKKAIKEAQEEKIGQIEEALVSYKEDLEEEYIDKVNTIIESLKPQIRKQILVEMSETNPETIVMEKIKELIFPLINEQSGKAYTNEIALLNKELAEIKKQKEISEGYAKKEKLLSTYSDKTKKILDKMIGEGSSEEVTQKFYELVEQFQEIEEGSEPITEEKEVVTEEKKEEVELIDEDFKPTVETSTAQKIEEERKEKKQRNKNTFRDKILAYTN